MTGIDLIALAILLGVGFIIGWGADQDEGK